MQLELGNAQATALGMVCAQLKALRAARRIHDTSQMVSLAAGFQAIALLPVQWAEIQNKLGFKDKPKTTTPEPTILIKDVIAVLNKYPFDKQLTNQIIEELNERTQ